jgi:hypothetical protein
MIVRFEIRVESSGYRQMAADQSFYCGMIAAHTAAVILRRSPFFTASLEG